MISHARDFRTKSGTMEEYYLSREANFRHVRNWKECTFLGGLADALLEEYRNVEQSKAYLAILRRIGALEMLDKSGDWNAADRVQKALVSETLLHSADMQRYLRQSKQLRDGKSVNNSNSNSDSKFASSSSSSGAGARPSGKFFGRFNNRRGQRSFNPSRSPARSGSKSPSKFKASSGKDGAKGQ